MPAALGLTLVVAGGYLWFGQSDEAQEQALAQVVDPGGPAAATPAQDLPDPPRGRWTPAAPREVVIPRLAVSAPVVPIRPEGEVLVPPSDAQTLGWWSEGAEPGAGQGTALVTGHTVHEGGGALDDLERLRAGDTVRVRTAQGVLPYQVTSVEVFRKGAVARQADGLFSQEGPGRLVLVTCEDWDGERYLSNVVVTATPA